MFDGKAKSTRQVSLASRNSKVDSKNTKELLENARKQREARALDRQRNSCALLIQKIVRSKLSRLKLHKTLRSAFDALLPNANFDNLALRQLLILLPSFFHREKDLQRLLAVNTYITSALASPELLNSLMLGLVHQKSQSEKEVNMIAPLIRCSRISVETLQYEIRAQTMAVRTVDSYMLSVVTFLSSLRLKEHVLGTYIALQLCKHTTKALKTATSTLNQTLNTTNNSIASDFVSVLNDLIQAAVGWTADAAVLAQIPTDLLPEFRALRKAAVVHIALNLFTQPNTTSTTNSYNSFAFHSVEDWLFILQHCNQSSLSGLTTTPSEVHSSFPVLSATEQLNLLSHFSTAVLNDPTVVKRVFAAVNSEVAGEGYAQLGRMFLLLVSNLFGHRNVSNDSGAAGETAAISSGPSTATAATSVVFANTLPSTIGTAKPSGSVDTNSNSATVSGKEKDAVLPLQLMAHLSLHPITTTTTTTTTTTAASTDTPSTQTTTTYATIYNSRAAEDPAMDVVADPHQELLSDYIFASGVKKLEYRSGGLQNTIVAAEKTSASNTTGVVASDINNAVTSLEQLAVLLSSRDVVTQLASVIAISTSSSVKTTTSNYSSTSGKMDTGDGSTAETAMDVDAEYSNTKSNSADSDRIVLDPITSSVVHIYTQLLLSYPSEVFATHSHTRSTTSSSTSTAFSAAARSGLLFSLAYTNPNAPLAPRLWRYLQSNYSSLLEIMVQMEDAAVLKSLVFARVCGSANASASTSATGGATTPAALYYHLLSTLYLFMTTLITQLAAVDDEELLEQYKLFSHSELRSIAQFLKKWLYKLYWTEPLFDINSSFLLSTATATSTTTNQSATTSTLSNLMLLKLHCLTAATKLFNHLCQRHERRAFLSDTDWCWPSMSGFDLGIEDKNTSSGVGSVNSNLQLKNSRVKAVLTFIPQVVPFKQRVSVLHAHLEQDKVQYFTSTATSAIHAQMGFGTGSLKVKVRRDHLVEDAYEELHTAESKLKGQIKVEFVSEQGLDEAGIDGGGLFKEFIDSFSKSAFSPSFGLFVPTSHQLLTPNPDSARASVVKSDHLKYLNFVGKILGKAVYERILLESEFAGGFLNFLLDRKNALDDLYHLDEQVYKSMMQMKHYANKGGDVEALELYFETTRQAADGSRSTHELIPGGAQVKVTKHNVHSYIHTLANYKLNVEGSEQCRAIRAGFQSMIPLEWVRMFGSSELQLLISGDQRRIDIADMKANVHYASGYHESQPYMQAFWSIVENMDPIDQGHLLRFVTSCSRQPLLGFGQLNPRFAIQKVPAYASQYTGLEPPQPGEAPRLPSAATCMNLLKLPCYDSVEMLREKLLYAIRSNSGFELS